jgi:ribosomal protein S18 acetylase RimI-like enzyme
MIVFKTLENTNIAIILNTFNLAFSDYIVPMKLTDEQLATKIKNENILLEYSAGAFENDELIGFILHGRDVINDKIIIYNGGTGVIPTQRGQRLTAQLYEFILPLLCSKQTDAIILEVITTNHVAIATYEKIGFRILRTLNCYKGVITSLPSSGNYDIQVVTDFDWNQSTSFWDWQPTWQNNVAAIEKNKTNLIFLGIHQNQKLFGYLLFNPKSNRIQQFAIAKDHRHKGLASQLFCYLGEHYTPEISMINIDGSAIATTQFLENKGFQKTVTQYEMILTLR